MERETFPASSWLTVALVVAVFAALVFSFGLSIHDDAFISFRYARNLADGHGLVFNPGERVEGYTNFSWTVLFAAVMALGLNPLSAAPVLGVLAGAGALVATGALVRPAGRAGIVGLVVLGTNASFALEAAQGLETCLFSALVGAAVVLRCRELDGGRVGGAGLICGLAVLTRPEGALVFAILEGVPWVMRSTTVRERLPSALGFAACFVPHMAFRVSFYGDVVPNTFHAKVSGVEHGDPTYVLAFLKRHTAWVALAVVGAWVELRRARVRGAMLIALCAAWFAYQLYVGGDYKPSFRFLAPVFVPLAALAASAVAWAGTRLGHRVAIAAALAALVGQDAVMTWPSHQWYASEHRRMMDERLLAGAFLREHYGPDVWVATHSIGAVPYASMQPTIDMWGLTDAHIARVEAPDDRQRARGHEKVDYDYVFDRAPELYYPHDGAVVAEPSRVPVPEDFPADFEDRYQQYSYRYGELWIQVFERVDLQGAEG